MKRLYILLILPVLFFLGGCPTIRNTVTVSGTVTEYFGETVDYDYEVAQQFEGSTGSFIVKVESNVTEISDYLKKLVIPGKGVYYLLPGDLNIKTQSSFESFSDRIENSIFEACYVPDDSHYQDQWNLKLLNMENVWDRYSEANQVKIAVLDTGVSLSHPDLSGILSDSSYDFVDDDDDPTDSVAISHSHGTHVTGIIAALSNNSIGISGMDIYGAEKRIISVRVLGNGGTAEGTAMDIASGIVYAVNNGAMVINMSLTGPDNELVHDAVQYAYENDVTVVCAAGNYNTTVGYPARYSETIAVGAVNSYGERSYYSNHGEDLDVMAPGGDNAAKIISTSWNSQTGDDYTGLYGTSMAAPHVSALVGMMISHGMTGVENIRKVLHDTAEDLGEAGFDNYNGYGLINPLLALGGESELPIEVLAISVSTGRIEDRTLPTPAGEFSLELRSGHSYYIVVWRDMNGDNGISKGDMLGYYGYSGGNHENDDPEPLNIKSTIDGINLLYARLLTDKVVFFF